MADYRLLGEPRIQPNGIEGGGQGDSGADHISNTEFINNVADVTSGLFDLLISKHMDYGPKNIGQSPGGAINGLRVRMHDKLARINNLYEKDVDPEHESLQDSFKDMANYAIIGLLVLQGKWPQQ